MLKTLKDVVDRRSELEKLVDQVRRDLNKRRGELGRAVLSGGDPQKLQAEIDALAAQESALAAALAAGHQAAIDVAYEEAHTSALAESKRLALEIDKELTAYFQDLDELRLHSFELYRKTRRHAELRQRFEDIPLGKREIHQGVPFQIWRFLVDLIGRIQAADNLRKL